MQDESDSDGDNLGEQTKVKTTDEPALKVESSLSSECTSKVESSSSPANDSTRHVNAERYRCVIY